MQADAMVQRLHHCRVQLVICQWTRLHTSALTHDQHKGICSDESLAVGLAARWCGAELLCSVQWLADGRTWHDMGHNDHAVSWWRPVSTVMEGLFAATLTSRLSRLTQQCFAC